MAVKKQGDAFKAYAPHYTGFSTPAHSVEKILTQVYKASLEEGYGGEFISHLGKGEKWL